MLMLIDILEENVDEKYYSLNTSYVNVNHKQYEKKEENKYSLNTSYVNVNLQEHL